MSQNRETETRLKHDPLTPHPGLLVAFGIMVTDEPIRLPTPLTGRLKELQLWAGVELAVGISPPLPQKLWHHLPRKRLGVQAQTNPVILPRQPLMCPENLLSQRV